MTQTNNNLYEGMFIISSALTDDARAKALEKVTEEITRRGGEIHKIHDMGRKRMAYEINGHRDGHYYLIYFSVAPTAIVEMKSEYRLMPDLIRLMILRAKQVMEKIEFQPLEI